MVRVSVSDYEQLSGKRRTQIKKVGDGTILTRFDKTPLPTKETDVVCPHFLELKWATGCPYNCAWCYLQGTFRFQDYRKSPKVKDLDKVSSHVMSLLNADDGTGPEVLNAGELSDSLLDELSDCPFSKRVSDMFRGQDRYKVLFVTKSDSIDSLLRVDNKERFIVSFSVNATAVSERWEHGAPSPIARLDAAKRLSEAGFTVRLRIDPMVPIDGWRDGYGRLVDEIFDRFVPERITAGSLRGLQSTINNSKDRSWVEFLGERSNWGRKVNYDIRLEMYRFLTDRLRERGYSDLALCKETVECWEALGLDYRKIRCNCML